MKLSEQAQISFQNWYPQFKDCAVLGVCIPIPDDVLEYLKADGVVVPEEAALQHTPNDGDLDHIDSTIDWESASDDEIQPPSFPDFSSKLKSTMDDLGGDVFVKLNWSAPTDAAWIATNRSLKCSNLQDIYLLLKSSDKIANDLATDYSYDGCKYYVVLKKWKNINPSSEFRCFVSENELVAITPRNRVDYRKHFEQSRIEIINDIKIFYNARIRNKFSLSNFAFDIARSSSGLIKILDFQLLNTRLNTYLFSNEEIMSLEYVEGLSPEFRYIAEDTGIQPNGEHFGMPYDLVSLPDEGRKEIIKLLQAQMQKEDN